MKTKDYYPRNEAQIPIWIETFWKKLNDYSSLLEINPTVLAQIRTYLDNIRLELANVDTIKKNLQGAIKKKDSVLLEAANLIRNTVALIKLHSKYTPQIGEELGIIAPISPQTIPSDIRPEYGVSVLPDGVRIDWSKQYFDGIIIESKRGNETDFTHLDKDTRSPYEDKRPNLVAGVPEIRVYRLSYLLNDKRIGQWTDEIKVIVMI